jgi:hypothetical protein
VLVHQFAGPLGVPRADRVQDPLVVGDRPVGHVVGREQSGERLVKQRAE